MNIIDKNQYNDNRDKNIISTKFLNLVIGILTIYNIFDIKADYQSNSAVKFLPIQ